MVTTKERNLSTYARGFSYQINRYKTDDLIEKIEAEIMSTEQFNDIFAVHMF